MNVLKKIGNIILILLGAALILICADLLTNKAANKTFNDLSEPDREAITEICRIADCFDYETGNETIWDVSYNPSGTVFAVIRSYGMFRGYCYVVNASLPTDIFTQKIEMPDEYSDISVYRFALCTPYLLNTVSSSFDEGTITINNCEFSAVKYDQTSVKENGEDSLEARIVKATFRDAVDTPDTVSRDNNIGFTMNEENIALTGLQYRIIDELLETDDQAYADELLCEYVMVRDYQASRYPDFEKQQERLELLDGTEQHVYYNVSRNTGGEYTYFNKRASDRITFYSAYYYICAGNYGTDVKGYFEEEHPVYSGAALCEIMDKFNMIPNWRKKLDNSSDNAFVSEYTLIKDYCSSKNYSDMTLENIQRSYNYEEVLSMAKALVQSGESTQ